MKSSSRAVLSLALFAGMAVPFALNGCQSSTTPDGPVDPTGTGGSANTTGGSGNTTGGSKTNTGGTDTGTGGTNAQGGSTTAGGTNSAGGSPGTGGSNTTGGSGGGTLDPCGGVAVTNVSQVANPTDAMAIANNKRAKATGLVAITGKYLVSSSKTTGSCLWGFIAADPTADPMVPYSGILVTASGAAQPTDPNTGKPNGVCPTGPDGGDPTAGGGVIPDTLAPGDTVDFTGFVDEHKATTGSSGADACTGTNPPNAAGTRQIEINPKDFPDSCFVVHAGAGKVPGPLVVSNVQDLTDLQSGTNPNNINYKYQNVLLDITATLTTSAVAPASDASDSFPAGQAVSKFGNIYFKETPIQLNNDIYYSSFQDGGPKNSGNGYTFPQPTTFTQITAIPILDYCTWELSAPAVCTGFTPAATTCGLGATKGSGGSSSGTGGASSGTGGAGGGT